MAFFRLNVPYTDKEEAKSFGAKWFSQGKYWYYDGEDLPDGLRRWYEVPERKDVGKTVKTVTSEKTDDPYAAYKTVTEVNGMISEIVYATNEFRAIMVKGEVTNFDGHRGRHYYFAIKDEGALLPCVMWEGTALSVLKFKLEKGQQVALIGSLEYYKEAGRTQLIVSNIENIGDGQANLALIKLKARLEAEGLFDEAHKQSIPKHPETVGIITSKSGQAIKDICKVANKRNPYVQLILYHVNVQGANAVSTITEGIKVLDGMGLDTIIVGRGGGSDEELYVYNDESIVRAVYEAKTPIVSAVGHQGHWTLIDYVADRRCATPSEAAEETIPNIMVDIDRLRYLSKGIRDNMASLLKEKRLMLESLGAKIEQNSPVHVFKEKQERLENLTKLLQMSFRNLFEAKREIPQRLYESIRENMRQALEERCHRFEVALTRLNGLSPSAKLVNGFGYITKEDRPVTDTKMVNVGDEIEIRIHDGMIRAGVTDVRRNEG